MINKQAIECMMCGACCTAYDISTLKKPAGVPCVNLLSTGLCGDYENRPEVCRRFKPDEICLEIAPLSAENKIKRIMEIYELM